MSYKFISLASGSSGNCYYIGTDNYGILIDAGIGSRTIKKALKEHDIPFEHIIALLITHDHADHIKYAGVLGEKYGIPVYATELVHEGINQSRASIEKIIHSKRIVSKDVSFCIRDFEITPFEVPHDGTDNVGYSISVGDHIFAIVTDLGHITPKVRSYLEHATQLVIEANYDREMLQNGPYTEHLKQRITNPYGHLANHETASFLCSIYHSRLSHVFLCHLSKENNHPELAYKTVEFRLQQEGVRIGQDLTLVALRRNGSSGLFVFE